MRLISWNVNGLRAVISKGMIPWVESSNPDILCLQETKISRSIVDDDLELDKIFEGSYHSFAKKPGYSGVSTLVKSKKIFTKQIACDISKHEVFSSEGRVLVTDHKEFLLYNLYFPSGTTGDARQSIKYTFLNELLTHLDKLSSRDRQRLVVCGDFNICHRDIDIHHPREAEKRKLSGFLPKERQWMDEFASRGFIDTFRAIHHQESHQYSWWTYRAGARNKNLGWRIDYIFMAKKLLPKLSDAGIYSTVSGSDHCPIYAELKV